MKSADIRNKRWTDDERQTLRRISALQSAGDDSSISFQEIPRLTEKQLAAMVRFRERKPKVAVSLRLDPAILTWLRSKGKGHLTRINDILLNLMEAERRQNRASR
jgi:uncharacterized protein (DUF4415 family)